jgi:protein TonB
MSKTKYEAHSTPDPDLPPDPKPPPVPDDVPSPANAPVEDPSYPEPPIKAA